jgi:hypothetical protein
VVGAPGFEPGASCAQGRRATRLRYAPTGFILAYIAAACLQVLRLNDSAAIGVVGGACKGRRTVI